MKVPASVRGLFEAQEEANRHLRLKVDERLNNLKHAWWHYESRTKELESFALKIETGRVQDPSALEDFFACTLVVRNAAEIAEAEALVAKEFLVRERRPKRDDETHKEPECFPFDDLRLYAEWRDDPTLPVSGITGRLFEVQVKTFLEHAWSIATHDLIYKTAQPHWGKQRIAFQIKAMLEHAEVSIHEAERLAEGDALSVSTRRSRKMAEAVEMFAALWPASELPHDLRRLAENVCVVADRLRIQIADLRSALEEEGRQGRGAATRNLSPFGVVIASLFAHHKTQLIAALTADLRRHEPRLVIHPEVELPADAITADWRGALLLGRAH